MFSIANHTEVFSKSTPSKLRSIVNNSDEYSEMRTASGFWVQRYKDIHTMFTYNFIYIYMAITEQFWLGTMAPGI
jgi:hypothetical protein